MPWRWAFAGGASVHGVPSRTISPEPGSWAPERIFTRVDLPAPLSPTRPRMSPRSTSSDTPSSALIPPKHFEIWRRLRSDTTVVPVSAAGEAPADAAKRDGNDKKRAGEEILREDRRADHG